MKSNEIAIIGVGRVGSNIAIRLHESGIPIRLILDKDKNSSKLLADKTGCQVVLTEIEALIDYNFSILMIATPDQTIAEVAQILANLPLDFPGKYVFHFSGAMTSDILDDLRNKGAMCASMHPVQSFTAPGLGLTPLDNIFWALEGDETALAKAKYLITQLKGDFFLLSKKNKPLYHAACVFASNYLVALVKSCTTLMAKFDIQEEQAVRILSPLIQTTFANILNKGIDDALTGPISRGDINSVQSHIAALKENSPELVSLYQQLAQVLIQLSRQSEKISAPVALELSNLFLSI